MAVLAALALAAASLGAPAGRTKRLLLDSRVVRAATDLELVPGDVVKSPANPVLSDANPAQARPWEVRYDNMNPNVYWDGGRYRLWYFAFTACDPANATRGTPADTCSNKPHWPCTGVPAASVGPGGRPGAQMYAESPDGIVWTKPALGLITDSSTTANTSGFAENNILALGEAGGILLDARPGVEPAQRYKLFGELEATAKHVGATTKALAVSPDGLRWSTAVGSEKALAPHGTHCNAVWDPDTKRYVGFGRVSNSPFRTESVAVSETESYMGPWRPATPCGLEKQEDDAYQPDALVVFPERIGGVWLGLANMLNVSLPPYPGTADVELAWSANLSQGWRYVRHGTPFIRRGEPGSYDCCQIFGAKQRPKLDGDQMRLFFSAGNGPFMGSRSGGLGVATLQRDWWFGLTPTKTAAKAGRRWGGELTTVEVVVGTAGQLRVSADARHGRIIVGVVGDERLTAEACEPIRGNVTEALVQWSGAGHGAAALGRLVGKGISLQFKLEPGAVLFAFDV